MEGQTARETPEEVIVICVPTAQLLTPAVGSRIVRCSDCLQPVWLSPTSLGAPNGTVVVCLPCGVERVRIAKLQRKPHRPGLLPGQLDEVRRNLERGP